MPAEGQKPDAAEAQSTLPLFYQRPELLRVDVHRDMRLSIKPDFHFAADTNAVPVMVSEFTAAARVYPIVFAGDPLMSLAVLGLEQRNLFVDANGAWSGSRTYIPAYVRRYPFTFIARNNVFALGIDTACERLILGGKASKTALPLFVDGKPTSLTQDALQFCGALQTDHLATKAFARALVEHDLLVVQEAKAVSGSGRHYGLHGFYVVDVRKFAALGDAAVLDWHRKGWLGLVHAHLASLICWKDLLHRVAAHESDTEGKS